MRRRCPACGKVVYRTEAQAGYHARRLHRLDGDRMTTYPCPKANGWHVAHVDPAEGASRRRINAQKRQVGDKVSSGQPEPLIRV